MAKILTEEQKEKLIKNLPEDWNKWSYRKVIRRRMKGAFYFRGQILKVKYFNSFGAFDFRNRWIDYYDVGAELKPSFWTRFWFSFFKWI